MNRSQIRSSAVATGAASLLLLSAAPAAQAAPAGPTTGPHEAEQAAAAEKCDGLTGQEAVDAWGGDLPDVTPDDGETWTAASGQADTEHYAPCDGLSAITIRYATDQGMPSGGPGYSITMLFHDGEYVGTDTAEPREWTPEVERTDEDTLAVAYPYGQATGAAGPAGHVHSTFTWNEDTQSVDHEGDVPPNA
ncbi:LppP/LprE family lipoprotein [Kocuria palustris]|uniref:LppP/LprE family lipoprotein n=1 Tax=Kocuria palustris TaxID=71999 RepID=UPI00119CEBC1|nr:LppP/LprE family lipoprotein [Kocuria palustris]